MDHSTIVIRGAREHNLRGVNLELPRHRLIVFTGVSGSGKSSLAFDTLYAEGQRRYVESLSSYARQFMGQMHKPAVDFLSGLSPAISIQQKTASRNPRSTVGTITEIHDYLRVLYARVGQGHCPECGRPITAQSREQIIAGILALPENRRCLVLAPVIRGQKGEYRDLCEDMLKRGYVRARVDGRLVRLTDDLRLDRQIKHNIEIVVDRLQIGGKIRGRLAEAVEQALALGQGNMIVAVENTGPPARREQAEAPRHRHDAQHQVGPAGPAETFTDVIFSTHYACVHCRRSYEPPSPQLFSFNSPQGMCLDCDGLGIKHDFDPELLVPDPRRSFADGAVEIIGGLRGMGRWRRHIYEGVAASLDIDLAKPWHKLPPQHRDWLLYGSGKRHITFSFRHRGGVWKHGGTWEGIIPQLMAGFKKTASGPRRAQLEKYLRRILCPACRGQRLNPQARAVRVAGKTIVEACAMPIDELAGWLGRQQPADEPGKDRLIDHLSPLQLRIAEEVIKELRGRLQFLLDVGLHYLTLDRSAPTLSGGEAQRIRLAGQIGSGLVGVLYILDEPSIGLHPRDNRRLLASLERLRDMGNTVIVVEHDEETMRAADYLVDFGPGPGVRGGEVVAQGPLAQILANPASLTGRFLKGEERIEVPGHRRPPGKKRLKVVGACHNNLKNLTVEIPLGLFVCVTGVSGSGKSSLINDILLQGLKQRLGSEAEEVLPEANNDNGDADELPGGRTIGQHRRLLGVEHIDKVIDINQAPIGRTPRSNPATYIKVLDEIRRLFAQLPQARVRGYAPGRFSFNIRGGRCEACQGNGSTRLEMDFLADVWVVCPVCEGRRFNRETLQVRFKDKSIHDVLEMDVQEALVHFDNVPRVRDMLQTLHDVGLDYLKLGQPSPTLSGGEAQRIKLARQLCRKSTGKTLYILDEPTTGLHFADIRKLLSVLHGFVEQGNTVLVIEHNLDVLKTADWIIDLGPEGGDGGGRLVCVGTPEEVAACSHSHTGQALQRALTPATFGSRGTAPSPARGRRPHAIEQLTVEGACQHNLKNVAVRLPRDAMTVFCGPSGSGKSSLAIDTIYAEGHRRYVESLSAYARQFLGQMQKPKVERVQGLSPAISIEQKTAGRSPRSTVGTITEIHDYLRVLYARLGRRHCPKCGTAIGTQTSDEIIDRIMSLPDGVKLYLMAPLERRGQEKYHELWAEVRRTGFVRIRVDGISYSLDSPPDIDHRRRHLIEVVVDRLVVRPNQRSRVADAVEAALELGKGMMHVAHVDDKVAEPRWKVDRFSQRLTCGQCRRGFESLNPHHFSFNSPLGWCPACEGLGVQQGASTAALIRDPRLSVRDGAIAGWPGLDSPTFASFAEALARHVGFSLDLPFSDLPPLAQRAILHGTGEDWIPLHDADVADNIAPAVSFQYKGLLPAIDEAARVSYVYRQKLEHLVSEVACGTCGGSRLRDDAAAVRFAGKTLGELSRLPLADALAFFKQLKLTKDQQMVAADLLREIRNRLQFLVDVGLEYLTLDRPGPTLSGGEAQRIRLASQIGSGLTGVLYVLDEPTIGLHPRDNRRLISALQRLRDLGNTLILVEHDREVIAAADCLLDFGPGAGDRGGEIVACGPVADVKRARESLTGQYLSGRKAIPVPVNRRMPPTSGILQPAGPPAGAWLTVKGARHHNLQNIDVHFPLGCLIGVSGVSGSGKSSLVGDVLYNTLARKLHRARTPAAALDDILGVEQIDKVINVDQSPIGSSPSSNPATYTGAFDLIRELFARLPESKVRGYTPRRFSFNKPGGRCEACEGNGQKKIEMHFLPDVWVECDVCRGNRYNPETLLIRYKGHSIADVLNLRVTQALQLFENVPKIRRVLQTLADVGLDYLALGQAAPTLSGGEAQRVKLAAELSRPNTGKTLYVLDEPTTGLHFDDVRKLLDVLNRLVDLGNTVIVIEHNLDMLKSADWIIDLGPGAGDSGGRVTAAGTPEEVAAAAASQTAPFLAEVLKAGPHAQRPRHDPLADLAAASESANDPAEDVRLPWQADGRRWHTCDRIDRNGRPCRWEGAALEWIVDELQKHDLFGPANWNSRTIVEVPARVKSQGWFLHASTGEEWLLWLTFRVAKNAFKQEVLENQLGIRPLNDTPGLEAYGDYPRVRVKNQRGPWQSVEIGVHWRKELQTPAFREFLDRAIQSFRQLLARMQTRPDDVMPWKINGERWHLSDKGFPPGKPRQWPALLLPELLKFVREVVPEVQIHWTTRDAITLRTTPNGKTWARWKTKQPCGLDCVFHAPKGRFNLARLEHLAVHHELVAGRPAQDLIRLLFRREHELQGEKLKPLLAELAAAWQ